MSKPTRKTVLADPINFNIDTVHFGDPEEKKIPNDKNNLTYTEIKVSHLSPDGSESALALLFDRCDCIGGISDTYGIERASMYLKLWSDPPTERQSAVVEALNAICEKAGDHIFNIRKKLGEPKMSRDDSRIKNLSPLKWKTDEETGDVIEGTSPTIGIKLMVQRPRKDPETGLDTDAKILTTFYSEDEKDPETGINVKVNPIDYIGKHSFTQCVVVIDNIYVNKQLFKLQLKIKECIIKEKEGNTNARLPLFMQILKPSGPIMNANSLTQKTEAVQEEATEEPTEEEPVQEEPVEEEVVKKPSRKQTKK
jgi:hypothetical protein